MTWHRPEGPSSTEMTVLSRTPLGASRALEKGNPEEEGRRRAWQADKKLGQATAVRSRGRAPAASELETRRRGDKGREVESEDSRRCDAIGCERRGRRTVRSRKHGEAGGRRWRLLSHVRSAVPHSLGHGFWTPGQESGWCPCQEPQAHGGGKAFRKTETRRKEEPGDGAHVGKNVRQASLGRWQGRERNLTVRLKMSLNIAPGSCPTFNGAA